ncbi:MAG: hypothetical protein EOO06_17600 [Chitinophagaceae bacterium]|nr:MAG: hypothetical protein EOO06_17600 [Chitinophagaceae bacterium]
MRNAHHLSDGLFDFIYKAITTRHYWIAFPANTYFLKAGDLHCFTSREEARELEAGLKEEASPTKIIYAPSVLSAYQQIEGQYQSKELLITKNLSAMNEQNFEYLKDNLKYLGFGESLAAPLREQIAKGTPDFQLTFETEINKKAFAAVLNFRKSGNTDMYFVNSYHATLQRSNGEIFDQAFYLNKGKGVTAKEAYNLLEGRAVYKELENKEGQKYHAWIQLDFEKRDKNNNHEVKQFHDAYGYDLKASLQKFNMRDIKEPDLADILIQSLKKGNLQAEERQTRPNQGWLLQRAQSKKRSRKERGAVRENQEERKVQRTKRPNPAERKRANQKGCKT